MRELTVALLLATLLYVVDAEVSYIEPKNYFSNDQHCVDLECAKDEWDKLVGKMTMLDEMNACCQTANDDILKHLLEYFKIVIQDANSYYNDSVDQSGYKQETYRTLYMLSNIVWFRANIIQEYVDKDTQKNVQACFKQPLDEIFNRSDNINACWKTAGDMKCEEMKEGGNGGGNEPGVAGGIDSRVGSICMQSLCGQVG